MHEKSSIRILYDEDEIARRNSEIAGEIARVEPDRLMVVAILRGSFIFAADLLRAMHRARLSPEVEFMQLSSYRAGTVSSGQVTILKDVESDVRGRDVLLIDDILESGKTLAYTRQLMMDRGAKSCAIAVLLDKHMRRQTKLDPDYVGFDCPDHFVVGYGMDVAHAFRELPFVGIVKGDA